MEGVISLAQPLPAGNAVRLILEPPAGSPLCRILRRASDTFTGPDDAGAAVVYEGRELCVIDTLGLQNEIMAFYKPYYSQDGGAWKPGPTVHATPRATYADTTTDVLSTVRDRLEAGLKVECERQTLTATLGYIQVFTAPPLVDTANFPVVTVHLESESPEHRAVGEYIGGDAFDPGPFEWDESEGWLASVRLQIVGWSLNPDQRKTLREAIRRVIVANLSVFAGSGMDQVELEQSDVDAMDGEFGVPQMFQTMNTFTCVAPVRVGGKVGAISTIHSRAKGT